MPGVTVGTATRPWFVAVIQQSPWTAERISSGRPERTRHRLGEGRQFCVLDTINGEVLLMQTATIQRRIEQLPVLSRAASGSEGKRNGEPCALKGACTVRGAALGCSRKRRPAPTLQDPASRFFRDLRGLVSAASRAWSGVAGRARHHRSISTTLMQRLAR